MTTSADCNSPAGPELGVVIIGRNEGERLKRCLVSVARSGQAAAIVYVDSGSSDGSREAAARLGADVVHLDTTRPFTAARGRNEGFAALKQRHPRIRYVQFIDGDCELAKEWLPIARSALADDPRVAVVCGRRRERYPEASVYNRLCDIEWDTPSGEALACGGDSLMRAEVFESVGGFRAASISGEEPELCVRIREQGFRVLRLDADMTLHDAAMTRFGQWWRRAVRGGFGTTEVYELHKHSKYGLYRRERARMLVWGGALPLLIGLAALAHPFGLFAMLTYPAQVCRIAFQRRGKPRPWAYAFFVALAKFPEFQGLATFYWRRLSGRAQTLIEYK